MSLNTISSIYEQLMRSQGKSDLTLSCHGTEFKVHKAIVCRQSSVLAAACGSASKEATSTVVPVDGFDTESVTRMILFLYNHIYYDSLQTESDGMPGLTTDSQQDAQPPSQLEPHPALQADIQTASEIGDPKGPGMLESLRSHIKMNAIAYYYDISELRHCANARFQNVLDTYWSAHDFPVIVREVFSATGGKELHNILSVAMAAHVDELVGLAGSMGPDLMSNFAICVIRNMAEGNRNREDILVQKVRDLESQLSEAKYSLKSQKQEALLDSMEMAKTKRIDERLERRF